MVGEPRNVARVAYDQVAVMVVVQVVVYVQRNPAGRIMDCYSLPERSGEYHTPSPVVLV